MHRQGIYNDLLFPLRLTLLSPFLDLSLHSVSRLSPLSPLSTPAASVSSSVSPSCDDYDGPLPLNNQTPLNYFWGVAFPFLSIINGMLTKETKKKYKQER